MTDHIRAIESQITRHALAAILNAGYTVSVSYDDPDYPITRSTDEEAIMSHLWACDEEWLIIHDPITGKRVGTIFLVHGNDGWDVICDHSSGFLDSLLEPTFTLADTLSGE